jgi:heme/copper-type cytochrome/quinol oxidase subunit 2
VTIKAAPKKETARIQVAPTSKLPPQATVRLTQPSTQLAAGPAPAIRTAAPAAADTAAEPDMITNILMWTGVAFSLIAAVLSYLAWAAAS